MKLQVNAISEGELIREYPIKGKSSGWCFKLTETSNGAWKVEGSDKWGRKVAMIGTNENELIELAEAEATRINEKIRAS